MRIKECRPVRYGRKGITGCGGIKRLDEFPVISANPDGRGNICRKCVKEYNKSIKEEGYTIIEERSKRVPYDAGRKPMPPMWREYLNDKNK